MQGQVQGQNSIDEKKWFLTGCLSMKYFGHLSTCPPIKIVIYKDNCNSVGVKVKRGNSLYNSVSHVISVQNHDGERRGHLGTKGRYGMVIIRGITRAFLNKHLKLIRRFLISIDLFSFNHVKAETGKKRLNLVSGCLATPGGPGLNKFFAARFQAT